jgi:hypothetical protein
MRILLGFILVLLGLVGATNSVQAQGSGFSQVVHGHTNPNQFCLLLGW